MNAFAWGIVKWLGGACVVHEGFRTADEVGYAFRQGGGALSTA